MTPLRRRPASAGVLMSAVLAALAACEAAEPVPPVGAPVARPPDALLSDPELQEAVELQVRRDAPGLIRLLSDPRAEMRARAAYALASVQSPDAAGALAALLGDPSADARRDAAFALGQLRSPEAAAPLVAALTTETEAAVRMRLIEALGKTPSSEASRALTELSTVSASEERERTLALARLGAVVGVDSDGGRVALLERLDHEDPAVRARAAYYFGRTADPGTWAAGLARVRAALDAYDRDDPAAMYLIQALGKAQSVLDRRRLREWAGASSDWRLRSNAMTALAVRDRDPVTRELLFDGLDDASIHVAVSAAGALVRGPPDSVVVARVQTWIERHPERWQIVEPLLGWMARLDEQAFVLGWIDALPAEDDALADVALEVLADLGGAEATERLMQAASTSSPRVAGGAVSALARRWADEPRDPATVEAYLGVFSRAVSGGDVRAAFAAAGALADPALVARGSIDTLAAALGAMAVPEDLEPMIAVLDLLGDVGSPTAERAVRALRDHPHPTVRAAARRAAARLGAEVGREAPSGESDAEVEPASEAELDWNALAALGPHPRLVLDTERGRIVLGLATLEAPQTVQTLIRLAEQGRFDGTAFHRVVPNFVIQGGDVSRGDGFGGPGFTIKSELTGLAFARGVVGMASAGKDTEGSQFFVTHSMQPHLDGAYTAFGRVLEGMAAVDRIREGDRILRASVESGR